MSDDITPQQVAVVTDDGFTLEAEWSGPDAPIASVVLAHPHPLHGGDMRSLVTSELFRALPRAGIATLRFNFRGVGDSEGTHGAGVDEALDDQAAEAEARRVTPAGPLAVVGWSFGADVSLRVVDPAIDGWCAVAPPLAIVAPVDMLAAADPRPKLLIAPEHDQFDPPDRVRHITGSWRSTTVEVLAGADHFCVGRTDRIAALVLAFVTGLPTDPGRR